VLDSTGAWERLRRVRTAQDAVAAGLVHGANGAWRWSQDATAEAQGLADLYGSLCLAGPGYAFGQLGQSLDGRIATRTGDAVFVTGEEDRRHLHRLRALADAVVIGADTAINDDPRLTVRACAGSNPVRVVLDHRGRVPRGKRVFADGRAPTLWLVGCAEIDEPGLSEGVELVRMPCDDNGFAPHRVLDVLARRGLGRVLVEGGGVTVSRFLCAGVLHRLYLTIAPVLIGDGIRGVSFPGSTRMRDALRAPVRRVALGEDTLFEIDLHAMRSHDAAQD
jgi:diaminohydroxyphosphoribosylaminopyrimidine deaminase/5-amino-6-(5-phosphoribosylamino)uracil reductase